MSADRVVAAVDGVWPISVAFLVLAVGLGFGVAHHSRSWIGS